MHFDHEKLPTAYSFLKKTNCFLKCFNYLTFTLERRQKQVPGEGGLNNDLAGSTVTDLAEKQRSH